MNSFTLLPSKVKIRKCHSYFSGFFITLEWHLCFINMNFVGIRIMIHNLQIITQEVRLKKKHGGTRLARIAKVREISEVCNDGSGYTTGLRVVHIC